MAGLPDGLVLNPSKQKPVCLQGTVRELADPKTEAKPSWPAAGRHSDEEVLLI